ncbi:MAG: type II toxin-antitoxin system VapC family toxin [Dermatophilus congolensis]|nr:type II toxin-antitoxin system VapC family toxin [Dermatophilus congolensis]
MSPIVLDTSVAMAWCFEDEATAETEALLDRVVSDGGVVPVLWTTEVANVLAVAERRGRVSEAQSTRFTGLLSQLPISVAPEWPSPSALLAVARSHGLSSYDATYLWLAASRGLALATLDDRLRKACDLAGVTTLPA